MAPWLHQVLKGNHNDNRNGAGVGLEADAPANDARNDLNVCAGFALVHGSIPRRNDLSGNSTDSNRNWRNDWCLRSMVRAREMSDKIIQAALAVLMGLMAWNFNTLNRLQLDVEAMMYTHGTTEELNNLKLTVSRLQWMLQDDGMEK